MTNYQFSFPKVKSKLYDISKCIFKVNHMVKKIKTNSNQKTCLRRDLYLIICFFCRYLWNRRWDGRRSSGRQACGSRTRRAVSVPGRRRRTSRRCRSLSRRSWIWPEIHMDQLHLYFFWPTLLGLETSLVILVQRDWLNIGSLYVIPCQNVLREKRERLRDCDMEKWHRTRS